MHRRARIKAVANLSTSRRPASKSSSEVPNKTKECESEVRKPDDEIQDEINTNEREELSESLPVESKSSDNFKDIAKEGEKNEGKILETILDQIPPESLPEADGKVSSNHSIIEPSNALRDETATFKTPLQMPRVDGESANASTSVPAIKHRRFKIAPRLVASRNPIKSQDVEAVEKVEEARNEVFQSGSAEQSQDFTLPSPTKARPETPREVSEQPSFIVNHNIQHSGAPPSPFPYISHGHSRIRTESLCSMKSNRDVTVANLQPRKNIRTEDQKIIDIKRESRERLSNKDLDKSQLTMFDMIYFNPQNNPMKPRDTHKTEKPKTVEVLPEVVEKSPVKKEPSAMPVPQLRIDANGDMVLDESSLVVENEQQKQNRILLATTDVVYDDELSGNYGHYKRQQRTKEWQQDETVKFYRCLNTVGPDFSLMLNLFPNRSRRDLKLKFKKEERNNPQLIDKALLKHNTFDLDELQREFDQEEEERKKEAEEKSSSEVKELVKRKILKKQEAKLKAEQHAKSMIEKILADGELEIRTVDKHDLKENLELDPARSALPIHKKRQYKRNPKKTETSEDGATKLPATASIMDGLAAMSSEQGAAIGPKKTRQPRKKPVLSNAELKLNTSNEQEPPLKKPRSSLKKNLVRDFDVKFDASEVKSQCQTKQETVVVHYVEAEHGSVAKFLKPEKHSVPAVNGILNPEQNCEVDQPGFSPISQENVPMEVEVEEMTAELPESTATSAPCDEPSEVPNVQERIIVAPLPDQSQDNVEPHVTFNFYQDDSEANAFNTSLVFCETVTFGTEAELPVTSFDVLPVVDLPEAIPVEGLKEKVSSPGKKSEKKPKNRKKKIKPVLVSRLKLDKDGEMVLDDSSAIGQEKESTTVCRDNEELPSTSEENRTLEQQEDILISNEAPVDENLNETFVKPELSLDLAPVMNFPEEDAPSTSSCEAVREEFDGEAFLDSLDLERLVLVEAQRDGKDVYEIHEIDAETQEIGDKPLDLPSRYVDLIISVMTQQEEEET